LRKKMN